MKVETKIEFFFPGSFFSESSVEPISHRDPHKVIFPNGAFAFRFFDVETQVATLEDGTTFNHPRKINESPTYYPGGQALTAADVRALPGDHEILLANMEANKWSKVIRTRLGNYQPFEAKTSVLI